MSRSLSMRKAVRNIWPRLVLTLLMSVTAGFAAAQPAPLDPFRRDLERLTATPHRLSGSEAGRAAADYIEQRLRQIGVDDVYRLDMPVWQTEVDRCELTIGDRTVPLHPMRPNITVPPTTPPEGLTGRMIYVGKGRIEDYGERDPAGAIVVLDYDSYDNWELAFALGAHAVIFLGDETQHPTHARHTYAPTNLVRLYASAEQLDGVDLTQDRERATVFSRVRWEQRLGRNLIARIRGSEPSFANTNNTPEAVVLAANYDTFGQSPHLSPGAREAANVAGLIQAAEHFVADTPRRDVLLMFLDNEARYHQGTREIYEALTMEPYVHDEQVAATRNERDYVQKMKSILEEAGLTFDPRASDEHFTLSKALDSEADFARDDLVREMQVTNLRKGRLRQRRADLDDLLQVEQTEIPEPELRRELQAIEQRIEQLDEEAAEIHRQRLRWDKVREHLYKQTLAKFVEQTRALAAGEITVDEADLWEDLENVDEQAAARKMLPIFQKLLREGEERFDQRLRELERQAAIDEQRSRLRDALAEHYIVLHADYNLSDVGARWGPVVGGWTYKIYNAVAPYSSSEGLFMRVMATLRDAAAGLPEGHHLDVSEGSTITDPTKSMVFAPDPFVSSGSIAADHGFYGLSFMTGYDARIRDGHPTDTVEQLDVAKMQRFTSELTDLLARYADMEAASIGSQLVDNTQTKRTGWESGKPSGSYAGLKVTGGLTEDRPAANAVVAQFPGGQWNALSDADVMRSYDPLALEAVDSNGMFRILAVRKGLFENVGLLAMMYDDHGRAVAVANQNKIRFPYTNDIRIDMFEGTGYSVVAIGAHNLKSELLSVLKANSNASFNQDRSLWGQYKRHIFFYISQQVVDDRVKVFQPMGPVVLGPFGEDAPNGYGVDADQFRFPVRVNFYKADDLWQLNEQRLSRLRQRGVTRADLEVLHSRARGWIERAGPDLAAPGAVRPPLAAAGDGRADNGEPMLIAGQPGGPAAAIAGAMLTAQDQPADGGSPAAPDSEATVAASDEADAAEAAPATTEQETKTVAEVAGFLERAASLAHRVYAPLRQSMDDLVYAIVILLLLAIPFAFAMERLLIGSTSIYARITGFIVMFLITFLLLYFMHPGFAIATTPIIIFLAFAIILLSSLVIFIVVRKFEAELQAMQIAGQGMHQVMVSKTGTMLAAVGMGMSTMRRRPMRTTLTAVTVIMLTFTILCFASFTRTIGVRSVYEGPTGEAMEAGVMVRKLDYTSMPNGLSVLLHGQAGPGGLLAEHWWVIRESELVQPFSVARMSDGKAVTIDGIMGLMPEEIDRWPGIAEGLGGDDLEAKKRQLRGDGVYLPSVVQRMLEIEPGDTILLQGRRVTFAGTIAAGPFQKLQHLDGQSILPVDFANAAQASASTGAQQQAQAATGDNLLVEEDVERDFIHLITAQVAVGGADLVRGLGGDLHLVNIYPGEGVQAINRGRAVAELVAMPVWAAGPEGVYRMILTLLTEVSGGLALAVPLLLGGLIIFGTLLGSISDREQEIYTFSALGLSPGHVGVLFFAEAAVYAVVGGVIGQLLALFVSVAASWLAQEGWIQPANLNFSSTNSLFAIAVVMATVMVSAVYPAFRAGRSANPGLARSWKMPPPDGDTLKMTFPFTVSTYDITGVVSFLAEHFRQHDDAGLGTFAASDVVLERSDEGNLVLSSHLALAPFDLGVTEDIWITAVPSEIPGIDEVAIRIERRSGAQGDWIRATSVFMKKLRQQFLLWRTLPTETMEFYRMQTLEALGEAEPASAAGPADAEDSE